MVIRSLRSLFSFAAVAVLLLSGSSAVQAQASDAGSLSSAVAVPSRITAKVDNASRVTLGHTMHPLANAANDRGALADATPLNRIHVVLKRSDAQEASLKGLIGDLHNPSSASYHKWLTPDQFGKQFGPSDGDIAAVQTWLQSQGFAVGTLNAGHQTLEISGNAGVFKKAFGAEIHKYLVNGQTHFANASDPQIPAALAPVFGGFTSLNNFRLRSYAKALGEASYEPATKKVTPSWTTGDSSGVSFALSPADFAVQYDLPATSTGTTGAGQTIAIINDSNINVYLVNQYRSLFGLPVNAPTVIVEGQDPGVDGINNPAGPNGDSVEAYLDVELAGSVAPNAAIDLVIGADTELQTGLFLAAERAVYSNIAPIISLSFGGCEINQGTGNQFINSLWQQAAAQGITVLVSSGDNGSAGCDNDNTQDYAVSGHAVNGLGSTPYNVSVGGTDFYYSTYAQGIGSTVLTTQLGNYWSLTPNNSTPTTTIKQVIPEQPWNDSQYGLNIESAYQNSGGQDTSIAGGSGGPSTCGIYSTTGTTCSPYPKPSWQTGAGVPADGARDLPDVSLFAANGLNLSYYPICASDADCQPVAAGSTVQFYGVGGTSASTPAFGGIMALVNQLYGRQGQANYTLYPLATQFPAAFHDVTVGTNSVPCAIGSTNCIAVTNPITLGGTQEGQIGTGTTAQYNATAGYDPATGLGTIDTNVLLANWNKVTFAASTTTLTPSTTTFAHGTAVTISGGVTGKGTPTGTVALMTDSGTSSQQGLTDFTLASGNYTGSVTTLPGGTYNIFGVYSGDGTNGASTSGKTSVTVTPEAGALALDLLSGSVNSNGQIAPSVLGANASIQYGQYFSLSAIVAPTSALAADRSCTFAGNFACSAGFTRPTGNVVFSDSGTVANTAPLNAEGVTSYSYAPTVGSHSITAAYSGDPSYNAVTSSPAALTVTKNTPNLTYSTINVNNNGQVIGGQQSVITLLVENSISLNGLSAAPTGTVTVTGGPAGTPTSVTLTQSVDYYYGAPIGMATIIVPANATPGNYKISLTYNGDSNYVTNGGSVSLTFVAGSGLTSTTTGTLSAPSSTPAALEQVTVTIAGQSGKAAPTGTVYALVSDGNPNQNQNVLILNSAKLPTSTTSNVTVTLAFSSASLLQGTNTVTLFYAGDSTYNSSSGVVTIQNLLSDFTLTAATPSVKIPASGTVTDTLNIASTNGFTGSVALSCSATGGVTCTVNPTVTLTSGQTLPVTVTLNGAGVTTSGSYLATITGVDATGKYVHTAGIQAIVGAISTTPNFSLSPASSSVLVAIGATATDVVTVASLNTFNSAVTVTCAGVAGVTCTAAPATVTPASGGSATSTLTLTGVTAGTYSVVVTGTSGTLVHTANVSVTVTGPVVPDFTLTAASSTASITLGTAPTTTDVITVGVVNGFNSAVALTCAAPTGVTCALNPTSTTGAGTSTATLTGTVAGTYSVVVTGISGTLSHTATISVTVSAAPVPGFLLSANAQALSVVGGQSVQDGINVTAVNGFTGSVALTCSAPSGLTCSVAPASVTPGTAANLTITTTTSAAKLEGAPSGLFGVAGGTVLAGLVCLLIPGKKRRWPALLAVMFCAAALGMATGCGGGTPSNPSMNYNVSVSGTSGSITTATTVVVTVTTR